MWEMSGFHQQFLNATPKTAESEHDDMLRWSRCLKVQTGTKPEIQLEATKLLSGEYTETFKTCLSPAQMWVSRHTLVWGGEAGSAETVHLRCGSARLNRCQICKSARYDLTIVKRPKWQSLYAGDKQVKCEVRVVSTFFTVLVLHVGMLTFTDRMGLKHGLGKNRFLHNLNNLPIFLYWYFFLVLNRWAMT